MYIANLKFVDEKCSCRCEFNLILLKFVQLNHGLQHLALMYRWMDGYHRDQITAAVQPECSQVSVMCFAWYVVLPGKSFVDLYEFPIEFLQYCTYFRAQGAYRYVGAVWTYGGVQTYGGIWMPTKSDPQCLPLK